MVKKVNRYLGRSKKQKSTSGFIMPSPAMLESYEEISPGFTKKLLSMVEVEQNNKDYMNKKILRNQSIISKISLVLAFSFSLIVLFAMFYLISNSKSYEGCFVFFTWFVFLYFMNKKYGKID